MKFLPYENFYIISPLSPDEIQVRLEEVVSPEGPVLFSLRGVSDGGDNTPFKGYVKNEKFKFKPNIIYHNSFFPQISGSIEAYDKGSRIHIKMKMYTSVTFVMIILNVGLAVACLVLFPKLISDKPNSATIIPYLFLIVCFFLPLGGFKSESISSRSFLLELFEGEIKYLLF